MKTWFVKFSCRNTMEENLGDGDIIKTTILKMNSWDDTAAVASCMKKVDSSIYEFKDFEFVNLIDETKSYSNFNKSGHQIKFGE